MALLASPHPLHFPPILPRIIPPFLLRLASAANQRLWSLKIPLLHSTSAAAAAASLLSEEIIALQEAADAQMEETSNGTGPSAALAKRQSQNRQVNVIVLDAESGEGAAAVEAALTSLSTASSASATSLSQTQSSRQPPSSEPSTETQPLLRPPKSQPHPQAEVQFEFQSQPQPLQRRPNPPATFKLTSPHPTTYLDTWIGLSSHSPNLTFLPQGIDPASTSPVPTSITSRVSTAAESVTASSIDNPTTTSTAASSTATSTSPSSSPSNALTLWLTLSNLHTQTQTHPHHLRHLKNTLTHSSTFIHLSLTDRRLTTLLLILLLRFWLVWAECVLGLPWHRSFLTLVASFPVPFVPVLAAWGAAKEGIAGVTFEEMMGVVDEALGFRNGGVDGMGEGCGGRWVDGPFDADGRKRAERVGWRFEGRRVRYRWRFGWVTVFVGRRTDVAKGRPR